MTTVKNIGTVLGVAIIAALLYTTTVPFISLGSAPSGLPASSRTATTTELGPEANVSMFSSTNQCSSRVVSTVEQGIMLIFSDPTNGDISSTTLSGSVGHWQGPSTTVAYDSGIYGCGEMYGYAGVSTTITMAEFN